MRISSGRVGKLDQPMKQDQPVREFERYMRKELGLVVDAASEKLVNTLRNAKLEHYANVIGSHVDDVLPKALLALGPPLTVGVLYLVMKTSVLAHPVTIFFAVAGMLGSFFFAIKYDHALKVCRYCGIGLAIAEEKNRELTNETGSLRQRISVLESQLSGPRLKDEDIPF